MFKTLRAYIQDFFTKDYHYIFCELCKRHTTHENRMCMVCSGQIKEETIND
jgi:hypothetical protein